MKNLFKYIIIFYAGLSIAVMAQEPTPQELSDAMDRAFDNS